MKMAWLQKLADDRDAALMAGIGSSRTQPLRHVSALNYGWGEISSERDRSSLCDIEKSSFKCFEIGLKMILPTQVHTQRITKTLLVHLPDL